MSFVIHGIGTALPAGIVLQSDALNLMLSRCGPSDDGDEARIAAFFRRSGVTQRHVIVASQEDGLSAHSHRENGNVERLTEERFSFYPLPNGEHGRLGPTTRERMAEYEARAEGLAVSAMRTALDGAEWRASELTHLVTASCSGFAAPGFDVGLIRAMGLSPEVQRIHVGFMGCHGAINAIRAAKAIVEADPRARVGVCCVELCSLHFQYSAEPDKLIASALFSDGGGAIMGAAEGAKSTSAITKPLARVTSTASRLIPESTGDMTWRIGDHGFEMTLSARVPDLIRRHLRGWLDRWLRSQGLTIESVRSWAVHPGGPKVLEAVREALSLPGEALAASRAVLSECGNMSSATVVFILQRLIEGAAGNASGLESSESATARRGGATPGVMLAFGPGLIAEAALWT